MKIEKNCYTVDCWLIAKVNSCFEDFVKLYFYENKTHILQLLYFEDILLFLRIFWLFPLNNVCPKWNYIFLRSAITSNISLFVEFKSIASVRHSYIDNYILDKLSPVTQWQTKCVHVQWSSFAISFKYFYFLEKCLHGWAWESTVQ